METPWKSLARKSQAITGFLFSGKNISTFLLLGVLLYFLISAVMPRCFHPSWVSKTVSLAGYGQVLAL